jgi:hypothetical protein
MEQSKSIMVDKLMSENIANQETKLIFLVSQPRAGSTLVQTLIAKHPAIATNDEPWLMLPLVKAAEYDGHVADYNARLARSAFRHLTTANGMDVNEGLRLQANSIYQYILEHQGKDYFLDKTPRYYEILSELRAIFPESLIIVLFRNPLAVLYSIISTWTQHRWWNLNDYKRDLLEAPHLLTAFLSNDDAYQLILHYEDIVQDPTQLANVFRQLGLSGLEDYDSYEAPKDRKSVFGDPKIRKRTQVENNVSERWQEILSDPQIWRVLSDYLNYLGEETLKSMGYNYQELRKILDENRPSFLWRWLSLPLLWLLDEKPINKRRTLRYRISRIFHALWRKTSKQ